MDCGLRGRGGVRYGGGGREFVGVGRVIIGIDHVQIAAPAGSEEEARKFYGQILEMTEIEKPAALRSRGGVWFRCGAQQLHVGVETEFAPAKKAHPAFLVDDVPSLKAFLQSHGFATTDDPLPNVQRFHVSDPFGNRLEFVARGEAQAAD